MAKTELRPNNYLEVFEKYQNGCDESDCKSCVAFLPKSKMCVFKSLELWAKWNQEERKRNVKNQDRA